MNTASKSTEVLVTNEYVELLTIFPNQSQETQDLLEVLDTHTEFEKSWGS